MSKQVLDARLHLIDRQVLDCSGSPCAVVSDLELTDIPTGELLSAEEPGPVVTNIITGMALGTRIFGGRPPRSRLHRIAWADVADIGVTIDLAVHRDTLDVTWMERWVRAKIIARIPGGRHDPQ